MKERENFTLVSRNLFAYSESIVNVSVVIQYKQMINSINYGLESQ